MLSLWNEQRNYIFLRRSDMNEKEIEHLLRSLGIGATYRGYRYLNYGIRLCLIDEDSASFYIRRLQNTFILPAAVWSVTYALLSRCAGNVEI